MKTKHLLPLLSIVCLLPVRAQPEAPGTNNSLENMQQQAPPPPPQGEHGPMTALSPEEKTKVKAAHDKAIQQDPTLEQKMKDARQAMENARQEMHAAMIKVDPTVEPILAKMMPPKWGGRHEGGGAPAPNQSPGVGAKPWHQGGQSGEHGKGMENLNESERQKLMSLRETVKQDPAVQAAHEALKSAATPEAREQEQQKLRDAMHAAMIKADPSIEPILEKMHPGAPPQPSLSPVVQ